MPYSLSAYNLEFFLVGDLIGNFVLFMGVFFFALFSYHHKPLRFITSAAVILYVCFTLASNSNQGWLIPELWTWVLGLSVGGTLIAFTLKRLAAFQGPWIEYDRTNKTVTAYKSRNNKLVLSQLPIHEAHYSIEYRQVQYSKSGSFYQYYLACTLGKDHWEPSSMGKAISIVEKHDGYYFGFKDD